MFWRYPERSCFVFFSVLFLRFSTDRVYTDRQAEDEGQDNDEDGHGTDKGKRKRKHGWTHLAASFCLCLCLDWAIQLW